MTGPAAEHPAASRSPLGLGPLETAILHAAWDAAGWLTIQDIRDQMDYPAVAYTTVAKVAGIMHRKGLLKRRRAPSGRAGKAPWWYRPARPASEHIGTLIAALLDDAPDPGAALTHALATARTAVRAGNATYFGRAPNAARPGSRPRVPASTPPPSFLETS
jgi:predicted transcriptional regulator